MVKWDYIVLTAHRTSDSIQDWLQRAGGEGWELVAVLDGPIAVQMVMKRPRGEGNGSDQESDPLRR